MQVSETGTDAIALDSSRTVHFIDLQYLRKTRQHRLPANYRLLAYDFRYDIFMLQRGSEIRFVRSLSVFDVMTTYVDQSIIETVCICHELGILFVGTKTGAVRCHLWPPNNPSDFINSYTQTKLFDFPILRLKPSADISTLYATSEDGNIVSLTLEIIENGAKICDEVRLNHLKSKGKGFYRYYLDGYNLDIRSEFITLKGQIEDAAEEHGVKMKQVRQGMNQLADEYQQQFIERSNILTVQQSRKLEKSDSHSLIRRQNTRTQRIKKALGSLQEQRQKQRLEYQAKYLPIARENERLQTQLNKLKEQYKKEIDARTIELDVQFKTTSTKYKQNSLLDSRKNWLGCQEGAYFDQQQDNQIMDQLQKAMQHKYLPILNRLSIQLNQRNRRQQILIKSVRTLNEELDNSRVKADQTEHLVEKVILQLNKSKQVYKLKKQNLKQLHTELHRLSSINSFEALAKWDYKQQKRAQAKNEIIKSEEQEVHDMAQYIEELMKQEEIVRGYLVKEGSDKQKVARSIEELKVKKAVLKEDLRKLQQKTYLSKYRNTQYEKGFEQISNVIKVRNSSNQPLSSHSQARLHVDSSLMATNVNKHYCRKQLLGGRMKEYVVRSNNKISSHVKENESLLEAINEIRVNNKNIAHMRKFCRKSCQRMKTEPNNGSLSLHDTSPNKMRKAKATPFVDYIRESTGKKLKKRKYFITEVEDQNGKSIQQRYTSNGPQIRFSGPMHAPNIDILTSFPNL